MLIVAGGGGLARERLRQLAEAADYVIAADSGLILLQDSGIEPDVVVGDFDSVASENLRQVPSERLVHDPGQDDTDLEKAIRLSLKRKAQTADIVGATGDRLDHALNAVSLILRYRSRLAITLHDRDGYANLAVDSPFCLDCQIGDRISLIPAPAAYGLRSSGLRYPLEDLDLHMGGRDAVSNEAISTTVKLTWESGSFLVYRQITDTPSPGNP